MSDIDKKVDNILAPKPTSKWDTEADFTREIDLNYLLSLSPFTESKDKTGESETCGVRLPNWLVRRITVLTENPKTPYQIKSDTLRDAVYLGIHVLNRRYSDNKDWAVLGKMSKIIDKASEGSRVRSDFRTLAESLEKMVEIGDKDVALDHLTEYINSVLELTDPWKKRTIIKLLNTNESVKTLMKSLPSEVILSLESSVK